MTRLGNLHGYIIENRRQPGDRTMEKYRQKDSIESVQSGAQHLQIVQLVRSAARSRVSSILQGLSFRANAATRICILYIYIHNI